MYIGMNGNAKPIKRSKALSKLFGEDINDFVYVTEDKDCVYFSDACSWFSNACMEN